MIECRASCPLSGQKLRLGLIAQRRENTIDQIFMDAPRTLRHMDAVLERRAMLDQNHIAPLAKYVEALRKKNPELEFQDFDPLDGGTGADMLFLLEKPGPMTSPTGKRQGSGFISRNNDDPTAEAVFNFMQQANIDRSRVVLWNVIPGWNKKIKTTNDEIRRGIEELGNLMPLLPHVRIVVLVGKKAQRAAPFMSEFAVDIAMSAHPSPKVRSIYPKVWNAIPDQWRDAGSL